MSENKIDKNMLALSLVVWIAVAISVIFMVVYTGISGVVFAFIVLVVAVGSWSSVIRKYNINSSSQESELANQIKELTKEIQELKKELEE